MQRYEIIDLKMAKESFFFKGVIPLGGARDAKQAEENAGALGWRLTNEEITELESHQITSKPPFMTRFWQHG
jgi:aryl-alcohol dehydrogenase-like predicted oxidoreductase